MIPYRSLLLAATLSILTGCGGGSDAPTSPVIDQTKLDTDKDGVLDKDDAFPSDPTETIDTDKDGIGNNADTDDDNDGVADEQDAFPLNRNESLDTDNDGIGNNADTDDDNDGVADEQDAFPLDPAESLDTDLDGIGNNADTDDDNDGVADEQDAFPLDPAESLDTDLDGIGNNADSDDDNDGVADEQDAFPLDPAESLDTDLDGIGNNADTDDDNDGVADEQDAFPLDSTEWLDSDGDGIGNNSDPDDDNDGVADEQDAFPLDPAESADTDNDGVGDNADAYPNDSACFVATDGDGNACYLSLLAQDTELKVAKSTDNFFIYSPQLQKIVEFSGQTEQVEGVYQPNPANVVAHLAYSDTMGLLVSYADHAEIDAFDRLGTRSQFATLSENNAHIVPIGRFVYFVTQYALSGWDKNGVNVDTKHNYHGGGIQSTFVDAGQNKAFISSSWDFSWFTIEPVTGAIKEQSNKYLSNTGAIVVFDDYLISSSLGTFGEINTNLAFLSYFGQGAEALVLSESDELAMLRYDAGDTQFTRFNAQFNRLDQIALNGYPVDLLITSEHAVVLTKVRNRLILHRLVLSNDVDNDNVPNADDAFPEHSEASLDADKDGYPDSWNEGADTSATTLQLDAFPKDALCWLAEHANRDGLCDYASLIDPAFITDMVQSEEGILYLLDSARALVYPFDSRTGQYLSALVVGTHNQVVTAAPTSMTYVDAQERLYFLNRNGKLVYIDENNTVAFFTYVSANSKLFAAEKYLFVSDFNNYPYSLTSYRKNGEVAKKNNHSYSTLATLKWNTHSNELLTLNSNGRYLRRLSLNLLSGEISELGYYTIPNTSNKPAMSLSDDGNLVAINSGVLFDVVNGKVVTKHQSPLDMQWYQDNQYLVAVNHDGVHRLNRYNTSKELLESRELVGTLVKLVKLGNKLYILENQNGLLIINEFIANDDSDGDGIVNTLDAFPNDVAASLDSDNDGFPDAWNDGYSEADSTSGLILDSFPNDSACWLETHDDGSGVCNFSATVPEYLPSITANGRPGELLMLSPENHRIYRWSLESNGYINPIVLPQLGRFADLAIRHMAYSDKLERIYLGFEDNSIGFIDLNQAHQVHLFSDIADLNSGGFIPIDDYLLSKIYQPLRIFNASGEVVTTDSYNLVGEQTALDKNRNILFHIGYSGLVRAQFSPTTATLTDLNINSSGRFYDSALSLSPNGNKLAVSSGAIYDATTLSQIKRIESFTSLVWLNDEQYLTIKQDSDKIVLKRFDGNSVLLQQDEVMGRFIRSEQIDNRVVILARKDNNSHFYLYEINDDVDGDGVQNHLDAFPYDAAASVDTDGDGYPDAWNVGYSGADSTTGLTLDAFASDSACWLASHDDGTGQCNYAASVSSYLPTQVSIDNQGMVYLLNAEEHKIYRWSSDANQYRNPIHVGKVNPAETLSLMTYSAAHNRLYLAYQSGVVSYIDLTEGKTEVSFFLAPSSVRGIAAVGNYLLVQDDSGAWVSHSILDRDGVVKDNKEWNYYSRYYTWNANNNRVYFFRDSISPNDLHFEEIDQTTGLITNQGETPYHSSSNIVGPIKVVNNGTEVILGSGMAYDAASLTESYNLGFGFTDLIETDVLFVAAVVANENTKLVFVDKQLRSELYRIDIEFTVKQMYLVGNKLVLVKDVVGDTEFETINLGDDDQDGLPVWWEQAFGLSDSDSADAQSDDDSDGLTALEEFSFKTKPNVFDTDGDGLGDGAEINTHLTSPLTSDTDSDGLSDGEEVNTYFTSPVNSDTDGDGFSDGDEVSLYQTDPNDAESKPTAITSWSENFESGQKPSTMTIPSTSDAPWAINEVRAQGRYSLGSGAISDNQTSMVELRGLFAAGTFTFDALVSSESCCDHLSVTINGEAVQVGPFNDSWATYSFAIEQGEHVIRWTYQKDGSVSNGDDKAFIDNLNFVAN